MKPIFQFNVDVSSLESAMLALNQLQGITDEIHGNLGILANSLGEVSKKAEGNVGKVTEEMSKLKEVTNSAIIGFKDLGSNIRNLAFNSLGKLTSVLKTAIMSIGALFGMVVGVFNLANGSNRTGTDAAMSGLSWTEQKALDDANNEIGFNADFSTHRAGFHKGADTLASRALIQNGVLSSPEEFDELKNDSNSYYKLNDKLYKAYLDIKNQTGDENIADEQFKQIFGDVLSQFGYGDFSQFKLANQNGVINRHKQIFGDTLSAYSGVDSNSLMKGERSLNKFSETLKAFGLNLASKILPSLTKGLNKITGIVSKISNYMSESGVLSDVAEMISSFVGLIITVGEKILGFVSKLLGGDITKYAKNVFKSAAGIFKGTNAWIKGDLDERDQQFRAAKEYALENAKAASKGISNVIGKTAGAITGDEQIEKQVGDASNAIINGIGSGIGKSFNEVKDFIQEVENNEGRGAIDSVKKAYKNKINNVKDSLSEFFDEFGGSYKKAEEIIKNKSQFVQNLIIDGKKVATVKQNIISDPVKGIELTGKIEEGAIIR